MFRLLFYGLRVARSSMIVTLTMALLGSGAGVALTYLIGQVVGRVPDLLGDGHEGFLDSGFAVLLVALVGVFVLTGVLPPLQEAAAWNLTIRISNHVALAITDPLVTPREVVHLEDSEVSDEHQRAHGLGRGMARGEAGFAISLGVAASSDLIGSRLKAVGSAALIGSLFSWWIAGVLLISALLTERYFGRVMSRETDVYAGKTEGHRRAAHTFELGMGPAAKELRVFGLGSYLVERYMQEWTAAMRPVWRARRHGLYTGLAIIGGHVILHTGAIVLAANAAAGHDLSLAAVASTVQAVIVVATAQNGWQLASVGRGLLSYDAMRRLPELVATKAPAGRASVVSAPAPGPLPAAARTWPEEAIRFEGVRFGYPGASVDVLTDVNLVIRSGEALGLVGVNGAGKSTLVKLLAGVYSPTAGRITVDGVDLAALDADALATWQHQVATIVQDFVRFPLSVRDNIALGAARNQPELDLDHVALRKAAVHAGIGDLISGLPCGWETVLDKRYEGGIDLSGGEWQRIALARALFAVEKDAGVLVLDEPAAALDVRAEAALVDRYLDLTAGVSSLIISHRFSVVRDADRICVLDGGQIAETGNHEELIASGGPYARMFHVQAKRYAESGDPDA